MPDNPAFIWDRPLVRTPEPPPRPSAPTGPAEPSGSATEAPAGAWVTLRQAHDRTGIPLDRLRVWARKGRVPSRMVDGPDGNRVRLVALDEVRAHAARLGATGARTVVDVRDHDAPGVSAVPEGSLLVPLEAWDKMLTQLGHLHEAGQQLAEARERAAKAETEAAFLRERLAELRTKTAAPGQDESTGPEVVEAPRPGEQPARHMPAWGPVESRRPEPRWKALHRTWQSLRRR